MRVSSKGVLYGVAAYTLWGLLPLYWKALHTVPAFRILCHRMVWSLPFMAILLVLYGQGGGLCRAVRCKKTAATFLCTASLLSINWFTYIWAVNAGHVVEASLGYFISPLLSVLLGAVFLRERLRLWQGVAVALALAAVAYLTFGYGRFPWIAVTLAFTFGFYGLLRKTASLGALSGLFVETALVFLPALVCLALMRLRGAGPCWHHGTLVCILLVLSGAVTALPLLWFAHAAKRVTLTTLGVLQYIAPTLHFLLGVFAFGEQVPRARLWAFVTIWVALCIYSVEGLWVSRRQRTPVPSEECSTDP